MKTAVRYKIGIAAVVLAIIAAAVFVVLMLTHREPQAEADPHAGQVYIYDGFDWVWMTPLEGVPVNELTEEFFTVESGKIKYTGSDYEVLRGIDVSEHQLDIDWQQVAGAGIDYAYIRVGRRGYRQVSSADGGAGTADKSVV